MIADILENFINENKQYIHTLTREDIGSTVIKVVPYKIPDGNTDLSYMGCVFRVEDESTQTRKCEGCYFKDAIMRCEKCKNAYYCSESCFNKPRLGHEVFCKSYLQEEYQQEVVIIAVDKNLDYLEGINRRLDKECTYGWINTTYVKDIDKLLQIIEEYRNYIIKKEYKPNIPAIGPTPIRETRVLRDRIDLYYRKSKDRQQTEGF